MKLFLMCLSFLAIEASKPNVYFKYFKTETFVNYTKFSYNLHVYNSSSIPFNLNNYFNIVMQKFVGHKYLTTYANTIIFISKDKSSSLKERELFKSHGENDRELNKTDSNGKINFKYSFYFYAADIIETLLKCDLKLWKFYGKMFIFDDYKEDDNVKILNVTYPSRLDAYLKFSNKEINIFCDAGYNFKPFVVIFVFFVIFGFVILIEDFLVTKLKINSSQVNNSKLEFLAKSLKK